MAVSLVAVAAVSVAACDSSADGPRRNVCGSWIGSAESVPGGGPWLVDISKRSAPTTVREAAGTAGTYILLSTDCESADATVTISNPNVITADEWIRSKAGGLVAVHVTPLSRGVSRLDVYSAQGGNRHIAFRISRSTIPSD